MLMVAAVTMLYTLVGGFLGASLTDVAQSILAVIARLAVPTIGIINLGGVGATIDGVRAVDSNLEMCEIVPGVIVSFVVAIAVSLVTYRPNAEIDAEFDAAVALTSGKSSTAT